jgi:spermidine/putrescine transport system substrate-binding protein
MNSNCTKSFLKQYAIRLCIVGFYLFLLAFCLYYVPRIKQQFMPSSSLNIYTFAGLLSHEMIEEFERRHDIRINVRFFDSNEELLAKFKINKGEGYDIITPSDYMVELLRKENLLYKLNHKELPIIKELDAKILGLFFDPQNDYSLPIAWIPFGILFNNEIFKDPKQEMSLAFLFENPKDFQNVVNFPYKISMRDDARESILLASLYLFGRVRDLSNSEFNEIEKLLIKQKSWVENYMQQDIGYFFFSDIIHIAITDGNYAKKIVGLSDKFSFKIPKEGGFLSIENLAVSVKTKNISLVYDFINFILSKNSSLVNVREFGFNPSNRTAYEHMEKKFSNDQNFFPTDRRFSTLHMLHNDFAVGDIEDVWLAVKGT